MHVHVVAVAMQVLSTGAVVVDLPGVRDANAARGAVAEKYMKSCNAVWIVADITRAVDNRTAKVRELPLVNQNDQVRLAVLLVDEAPAASSAYT